MVWRAGTPGGFDSATYRRERIGVPPPAPGAAVRCACTGPCAATTGCPCAASVVRRECGAACACAAVASCSNRAVQAGLLVPLAVHRARGKGLTLVTDADVAEGAFVLEYAGEALTADEAALRLASYDRRGVGHALLTVRETIGRGPATLRTTVDATVLGNSARWVNHACGDAANLEVVPVRVQGSPLPRIALCAKRRIKAGSELTFAYGSPTARSGGRRCLCGGAACGGFLPREAV